MSSVVVGKHRSECILCLAYPDYDGGSPVIDFEVQVTNLDRSSRIAYRGRDLDCTVAGLLPGRPYLFQVRAFNRAGVCIVCYHRSRSSPQFSLSRPAHGQNILIFFLVRAFLKHHKIFSSNVVPAIVR
jgi:hypothetical protein